MEPGPTQRFTFSHAGPARDPPSSPSLSLSPAQTLPCATPALLPHPALTRVHLPAPVACPSRTVRPTPRPSSPRPRLSPARPAAARLHTPASTHSRPRVDRVAHGPLMPWPHPPGTSPPQRNARARISPRLPGFPSATPRRDLRPPLL